MSNKIIAIILKGLAHCVELASVHDEWNRAVEGKYLYASELEAWKKEFPHLKSYIKDSMKLTKEDIGK